MSKSQAVPNAKAMLIKWVSPKPVITNDWLFKIRAAKYRHVW